MLLEMVTSNKAVIPDPLDQDLVDAMMLVLTAEERDEDKEVSMYFQVMLKLVSNISNNSEGVEFISNQYDLMEFLIDLIPFQPVGPNQTFTFDVLHVFRNLLRSDNTYFKIIQKYPNLGDIIVMRLTRKSNNSDLMNEGVICLRNFIRNPSMVSRMDLTSVDCLVEIVRQFETFRRLDKVASSCIEMVIGILKMYNKQADYNQRIKSLKAEYMLTKY